jgi:hypothetical protein
MKMYRRCFIRCLGFFWICVALPACAESKVVVYPAPADGNVAGDYKVTVDDKEVFVFNNPVAAIAAFDFEGEVEIAITPKRDVKWVDVRPLRLGIEPVVNENTIRFKISQPCTLSIELNKEILSHPLFLFANPIEKDAPKQGDKGVHYFEAGKVHKPGVIEVNEGEVVYIAGGAVVEGAILANNANNIRVCGRGILDGTRMNEFRRGRRMRFVQLSDCNNIEVEGIILSNSKTWQIMPFNCNGVTIRNVKIVSDSGSDDGIDIVSSRNVAVEKCFVHTKDDCVVIKAFGGGPNYPGKDQRTAGADVNNVVVRDCVFWNAAWGNALEIGFELRANSVSNVTFKNCDIIHVEDGATFSIHNGDLATVSNIRFEDIRVEDSAQKLFDFAIFLSQYSADRPEDPNLRQAHYLHGAWDGVLSVNAEQRKEHSQYRGQIKDIYCGNIAVVDGRAPFSVIYGFDDKHRVENVMFENLTIYGRKIRSTDEGNFWIENALNVTFR